MKFENDRVIQTHFALGVIVLVLDFFQHIGGVIIKHTMEAKKPTIFTGLLSTLRKGHQINGFVLYLVTKATVLVGIWVYDYFELLFNFLSFSNFHIDFDIALGLLFILAVCSFSES